MTVGEAIKILLKNDFVFLNQVGSHKKYGRGSERITIVFHKSPKEIVHSRTEKQINTLCKK